MNWLIMDSYSSRSDVLYSGGHRTCYIYVTRSSECTDEFSAPAGFGCRDFRS